MAKRIQTIDKDKVREIYFWIIKTRDIYFNKVTPLLENYTKKYIKGDFDKTKAVKGFENIVPVGVRSYEKTFTLPYSRVSMNSAEKHECAKMLYDYYEDMMKEMFKKARKFKK